MTSTSDGEKGMSYGWINYDLIAKGTFSEHFTALGGEERFWLGPEGGRFALYFREGSEFTFDNWYVPKAIDSEPFNLASSDASEAKFDQTNVIIPYRKGDSLSLGKIVTDDYFGKLGADNCTIHIT